MRRQPKHSDPRNSPGNLTASVGAVEFIATDTNGAIAAVRAVALDRGRSVHVHFANAYSVALASKSTSLMRVFNSDDAFCFPDGKPISWISKLSSKQVNLEQVRGPGFFELALQTLSGPKFGHYFIGGRPEVLDTLVHRVKRDSPGTNIVGFESPPFRPSSTKDVDEQVERILKSGANVVWVGLGTPKQDFEAEVLARRAGVTAICVGAAFDFYAGSIREAPSWMGRIGVEWLFRFASEPRRLWRRYTVGNIDFIRSVVRNW